MLETTLVFNGTIYRVGLPVDSDFEWKTWRFGYEFDFVSSPRGFVGLLAEAKLTDVKLGLGTSGLSEEATARVTIPAASVACSACTLSSISASPARSPA